MPTFTAAAGVDVSADRAIDGVNVLPALTEGKALDRATPLFWWLWHARGGFEVAMRAGDYKLVATMVPQAKPGDISDAAVPEGWSIMEFIKKAELDRFEMYDLGRDPSEAKNVAQAQPERFAALRQRMIQLHAEIRAEGPVYELGRKTGKK